jgi:hypothetical protein
VRTCKLRSRIQYGTEDHRAICSNWSVMVQHFDHDNQKYTPPRENQTTTSCIRLSFGSIAPADQPPEMHAASRLHVREATPASTTITGAPAEGFAHQPSTCPAIHRQSFASQAHRSRCRCHSYVLVRQRSHTSCVSILHNLAAINLDFVRFGRDRDRGSSVVLLAWRCGRVGHYESYVQEAVKDVFR